MQNIKNKDLLQLIKDHDSILIGRHEYPDFDAQGSQYGLYYWIKENFPNKKVHVFGKNINMTNNNIFFEESLSEAIFHESLVIICDVQATERVDDQRYKHAKKIIVIDHHIVGDKVGNQTHQLIEEAASSTSEIVAKFFLFLEKKYKITSKIMESLFFGIITDTNRFLYTNTSEDTFKITYQFIKKGLNIQNIYSQLYVSSLAEKQLANIVFQKAKINKHVASFIMKEDYYKKLKISYKQAKNYVFPLTGIQEIKAVIFCSYDAHNKIYRVSLRARKHEVNQIAKKYGGGGHKYAAGFKLKNLKLWKQVIKDLENLVN